MGALDAFNAIWSQSRATFGEGVPVDGTEYGADIAACIVEPVAGSTGVLIPPKGYLEKLRAICDKHGILLIFDEVITGFGRVGEAFAAQRVKDQLLQTVVFQIVEHRCSFCRAYFVVVSEKQPRFALHRQR